MLDLKKLDKKIELGDIFFIDAGSIYSFGVSKEDDMIGDRYGTVSSKYSDMLFAVKYIGNAVVEEMLTGEKILLCGEGDRYRKDFHTLHKDFEQVDFGKYYSVPLSVEFNRFCSAIHSIDKRWSISSNVSFSNLITSSNLICLLR